MMHCGWALRIPHMPYLFYCLQVLAVANFLEPVFGGTKGGEMKIVDPVWPLMEVHSGAHPEF
jgi:hypothetical protein